MRRQLSVTQQRSHSFQHNQYAEKSLVKMTHDQEESPLSSSGLVNDLLSQVDDDGIRQIIHVQKERFV